jgi:hypothetical protein
MKVVVGNNRTTNATVSPSSTATATAVGVQGPPGPAGIQNIAQASDVDASNLQDGSLLIYKGATQKFTTTTTLESQIIEGGHF